MRITIKPEDNDSWLNWGRLVYSWIKHKHPRPATVGLLRDQLKKAHVDAVVEGDNDRTVTIVDYDDDTSASLLLVLPSEAMLDAKYGAIKAGPYPLPAFYDIAFGGASLVNFSLSQAHDFGAMRIGEYTINECC